MIAQEIQWCITVIHNASIRAKKRRQRFNRDILTRFLPNVLPAYEMPKFFNRIELLDLLKSLPVIESQVVFYNVFLGLTQQDISEYLRISQQQVSRLKKRALNSLKNEVV